jgi:LuxR family transcriptional regulator, maltose regulon positive regulatory protein
MSQTIRAGHHRPPPVPRSMLRRGRVLDALDEAHGASVVVLQAPGGYGKTTALAQWAASAARPVVWLAVRPAAADAHWLAQTLLGALHDEGLVPDPVVLPGHVDPVSWQLMTLPLVEDLLSSIAEPVVVVVDDAGALTGAPWESLVESLAVSLPEGSTLAMTTRGAVPATLWRLNSRGLLRVVGPEVLAFDAHEARQLMALLGVRLRPGEVERLVDETQGWPVALYLAGLSGGSGSTDRSLSALGAAGLNEYLRADIVARLSAADASFLERVSVLSALDTEGCDAVTHSEGSLARLRRLASANHLLAPQDTARERFTMHPLLAQFLGDELREREPDGWKAAHEAASLVEERRGDIDSAVHHAKLVGDHDRLSALVWPHTTEELGYGRWSVVQRWLGGLDAASVRDHCGLALSAAWVALMSGDSARTNRLALEAAQCARDREPAYAPDVGLVEAAIGAGGLGAIETSTLSFIRSRPGYDRWQAVAHFLLGVSLVLRDRADEGVEALTEGYRRAEALDVPIIRAHCLTALADAALAQGKQDRALTHIRELRVVASTHRLDVVVTAAPMFTTSTLGYVIEGRYADARRESVRALRLTALMGDIAPWHAVQGRLALARVNLLLGDPARARVLLAEAGDARGPANASPLLDRLYAETEEQLREVTTSLDGTSSLTTAEVRVLQYLPTHLSFPQIAEELVVSRHTVKTQAMSAYRKLGVHTRTEAIERARQAGLLPRNL